MFRNSKHLVNMAHFGSSPLEILQHINGYYECPKDNNGKRLGPLVGYAGKDKQGRHFVGDVYANFAKADNYPQLLKYWAEVLKQTHQEVFSNLDVICAAPMGGLCFGEVVAIVADLPFVFLEKKVIKLATENSREESLLEFNRHEMPADLKVGWVEDVFNNFSTTDQGLKIVADKGSQVTALIGLLNRSLSYDSSYNYCDFEIPIVALVRKKIDEYQQDDPFVADDIAAGNIIWKPKNEWEKLLPFIK